MTLGEIAAAAGGRVIGDVDLAVTAYTADSRTAVSGALFVAVRAERDGHAFVGDAFERGAVAALVERPPEAPGFAGVQVADTVGALALLAGRARERLGDPLVIAITGSTGKTSTKDLTAAALASRFSVAASPASYNNELGVPLTVLGAQETTEALVVEIGARGPGQIAALAPIVGHRIGVVTTVGAAHTEMFGTVEAGARAKAELLEALPPDGTAVVGLGHRWVDVLRAASPAPVLTVGADPTADVGITGLSVDALLRPTFTLETPWGSAEVRLEMRGTHQASNAAMAIAAAVSGGVLLDEAVPAVARARGSRWRMEVERTPGGVTVINDAYNANPASMAAALDALALVEAAGRRWAVLGEMAELGARAGDEHRAVGRLAGVVGVDRLVAVGEGAAALAQGAREGGVEVLEVDGADEALAVLVDGLAPGDAVLVKASRVVGLERVAEGLLERAPAEPTAP